MAGKYQVLKGQNTPKDWNSSSSNGISCTAFLEACFEGSRAAVDSLLRQGASVNSPNAKGVTGLMLACHAGHQDVAELLLEKGANAHMTDSRSRNVLFYCMGSAGGVGSIELLKSFSSSSWSNPTDKSASNESSQVTSMTSSMLSSSSSSMTSSLTSTKTPSPGSLRRHRVTAAVDVDGVTLLMEAAFEGKLASIQYLFDSRDSLQLDIHALDKAGRNAVHYACENSQPLAVDRLHSYGVGFTRADNGTTPLMQACLRGDASLARHLLLNASRFSLNVNDLDDKGRNCLFYAVTGGAGRGSQADGPPNLNDSMYSDSSNGVSARNSETAQREARDADVLQQLLLFGVNPTATAEGITLLMQAAGKKQLGVGRFLLDNSRSLGVDINSQDRDGWTALLYATSAKNVALARLLVDRGARAVTSAAGKTIFMQACESACEELVGLFYDQREALGLDVRATDAAGWNACYYCLLGRNISLLTYCLSAVGLSIPVNANGVTLLMEAVDRRANDFVRHLVEQRRELGINPNARDTLGCNALFYCTATGDINTFKYLLNTAGAKVADDSHGRTVLMQAAYNGRLEMVDYLLENDVELGLDAGQKDSDGRNVLFYCVEHGSVEMFEFLLGYGIGMEPDHGGKNNFFQAVAAGHTELVEYMVLYADRLGVDVRARDRYGHDAMHYYCKKPSGRTVYALLKRAGLAVERCASAGVFLGQALRAGDTHMAQLIAAANGPVEEDEDGCVSEERQVLGNDVQEATMSSGNGFASSRHSSEGFDPVSCVENCNNKNGGVREMRNGSGLSVGSIDIENGTTEVLLENVKKYKDSIGVDEIIQQNGTNNNGKVKRIHSDDNSAGGSNGNGADVRVTSNNTVEKNRLNASNGNGMSNSIDANVQCESQAGHFDLLHTNSESSGSVTSGANSPGNHKKSQSTASEQFARAVRTWRSTEVDGQTVFHWIAARSDVALYRLLAHCYEETPERDVAGRTPLMIACCSPLRMSPQCVCSGAGISRCLSASSPLSSELQLTSVSELVSTPSSPCPASWSKDAVSLVTELASVTPDLDAVDGEGRTALWLATACGFASATLCLLQRGAACVADSRDVTPLMAAAAAGNVVTAQHLLSFWGHIEEELERADRKGRTALHHAAVAGSAEVVSRYLNRNGRVKEWRDGSGKTALMLACERGHTQTVSNLIYYGADVNTSTGDEGDVTGATRSGELLTALHLCVDQPDPSLTSVRALCKKGKASVDARDSRGQTPLMMACRRGHLLAAKCLLDFGADPIALDFQEREPLDYCQRGDYQTKELLKKYSGVSPVERWCLEKKRPEYREVLDVRRVMHLLQREHIVTATLEAIVLADPSFSGRVDRLLDIIMSRGRRAFSVFHLALREYYPILAHELMHSHYVKSKKEAAG